MSNNNKYKYINNGFTLIEILLYLSLFVIIIGGSVGFIHTMLETNNKTKIVLKADTEADHVLSIITQYTRNSAAVLSPNKNTESNILVLQTFDTPGLIIIFGIINNSIVMSQAGQATTTLTSSNIKISNLKFINAGNVNGKDSVHISFTVNTQGESTTE